MSDTALNKVEFYPEETVVWANVQSCRAPVQNYTPKDNFLQNFVWWAFFAAWCIYNIITGDRSDAIVFGSAIAIAVVAVVLVKTNSLEKFYTALRRLSPTSVHTYLSCVVTDQRVILFDLPGQTPVSLPRNSLDRVWQDFAEGSQALLFRQTGDRDLYAFISTINFGPALRALDMNRTTP